MIKFRICQLHNQPMDKVCALTPCHRVMCSNCFLSHQAETSHRTSIVLNQHSLNFFTTFTGFVQYKLRQWADNIRRNGYEQVFESNRSIGILGRQEEAKKDMRQASAQVFEAYSQLMLGNRQFVVDNQSNEQLFHHEFLKDICALLMERWQCTAKVIIGNLKARLKELFPTKYYYQYANFKIRDNLLGALQSERMNMVSKIKDEVFYSEKKIKARNRQQIDLGNQQTCFDRKDEVKTETQLSANFFQLAWSIRRIESSQEIGDKFPSFKNVCFLVQKERDFLPPSQQLKQSQGQKQSEEEIGNKDFDGCIGERLISVQQENKALKQENSKLKEENQRLNIMNLQLTAVCSRMPLVDKKDSENTMPSSSKLFEHHKSRTKMEFPLLTDCISELAKQLHLSSQQICSKLSVPKQDDLHY